MILNILINRKLFLLYYACIVHVSLSHEFTSIRTERKLILSQTDILSTLYNESNGNTWTIKTNWLTGTVCPSGGWYGIVCSGSDIISLDLNGNNLLNTLPSQIGLLSLMTTFRMHNNILTGSLPSELGQMTMMQHRLFMYSNSFNSAIPSELGLMTGMTSRFFLYSNQLSKTIPSELGLMSKLGSQFSVSFNELTGLLPSQLGQMTSLSSSLFIFLNSLSGSIPSQLGQLKKISNNLKLYSNQFCGDFPIEVSSLSTQVTTGWDIQTGNSLGTLCCLSLPSTYTCTPTLSPTISPTLSPTFICGMGNYYDNVSTSCIDCSIGYYSNSQVNDISLFPTSCELCPNGKYNNETGQSSCYSCNKNEKSNKQRNKCIKIKKEMDITRLIIGSFILFLCLICLIWCCWFCCYPVADEETSNEKDENKENVDLEVGGDIIKVERVLSTDSDGRGMIDGDAPPPIFPQGRIVAGNRSSSYTYGENDTSNNMSDEPGGGGVDVGSSYVKRSSSFTGPSSQRRITVSMSMEEFEEFRVHRIESLDIMDDVVHFLGRGTILKQEVNEVNEGETLPQPSHENNAKGNTDDVDVTDSSNMISKTIDDTPKKSNLNKNNTGEKTKSISTSKQNIKKTPIKMKSPTDRSARNSKTLSEKGLGTSLDETDITPGRPDI